MRRRTQHTTPPQPATPVSPAGPGYDWARFGRHRLRAPIAVVLDLPVPVAPGARPWVATIWPDPHVAGGWARDVWDVDPERGGWALPGVLAAGDVLEFGADSPAEPVRWYGIMDGYQHDAHLTVQGPYPHPATAWDDAQRLLATDRYLPPLTAAPSGPATSCGSRPRQRCRHRR